MKIIIQTIIIIAALSIAYVVLSRRGSSSGKAWKKIGLVLLAISMVVAVLFPELTNDAAHAVGVGRGADLLLYALVVAFIFYALNNYLYQQEQRARINRLSRFIALSEAKDKYLKK